MIRDSEHKNYGWETRFREAIADNGSIHEYLSRIAREYRRKGDLPSSVMLVGGCSFLPAELLSLFGPDALHLSASGDVRLRLRQLLEALGAREKQEWINGLFAALEMELPCRKDDEDDREIVLTVLERFRLANKDMQRFCALMVAELEKAQAKCSRLAGLGEKGLFRQFSAIAETVRYLRVNREIITVSDLGARFFGDSKLLRGGELRSVVADCLIVTTELDLSISELREFPAPQRNLLRERALGVHGVSDNLGASKVTFYGPLIYRKNGLELDYPHKLWLAGEPVTMSLDNLTGIEHLRILGPGEVYGCENESPFYALIRQRCPGVIVYTQGFPNFAVRELWRLIHRDVPECQLLHWGDTDLAGLRIAAMLHEIAPLKLWRCGTQSIQSRRDRLIPIDSKELARAQCFLENNPHFPFSRELETTIRCGWLEQESY